MHGPRLASTLLLAATLSACGGTADQGARPSPAPTSESAMPEPTPRDVDPALAGLVDTAIDDLTDRLGVPEDQITLVSAELVTWSDASLGCPQPGMRYAQVVTDGARIVLAHDGRTYDYHSGGSRPDPFLCEQPAPSKSAVPTIDRTAEDT